MKSIVLFGLLVGIGSLEAKAVLDGCEAGWTGWGDNCYMLMTGLTTDSTEYVMACHELGGRPAQLQRLRHHDRRPLVRQWIQRLVQHRRALQEINQQAVTYYCNKLLLIARSKSTNCYLLLGLQQVVTYCKK